MPSRLSPLKIGVPTLPPIPYPGQTDFHQWVAQLYVELELYFNKMKDQLIDSRGFLLIDRQRVVNGFTVEPSGQMVDLYHDGPVVSSPEVAIAHGTVDQQLTIVNASGGDITIAGTAMIFPEVSVVIAPLESAMFRWDENNLIWVHIRVL